MNLNLKRKLTVSFLLMGLVPLLICSVYVYYQSKLSLAGAEKDKLVAVSTMKKIEIANLFQSLKHEADYLSSALWLQELALNLESSALRSPSSQNFLADPNYKASYDNYFPSIAQFVKANGLYDVFLISTEGLVYFTYAKESDFGSNLKKEKTDLAKAWSEVMEGRKWYLTDTRVYAPSNNAPAQFLAVPMYRDKRIIGVLAFQVPLEPINAIMGIREGMGKSGESYLVGPDYSLRSDTYINVKEYSVASTVGKEKLVKSAMIEKSFMGQSGVEIGLDYLGNEVLSSFQTVEIFPGLKWSVISEVDTGEALASVNNLFWLMLVFSCITGVVVTSIGLGVSKKIAGPIQEICESVALITNEVRSASVHLSGVATDLSNASAEQAAAIEETSASLEELTGILSLNSEAAKKSSGLAKNVSLVSSKGNQSMEALLKSMESIMDSNERIASLGGVIENIGAKTEVMDEIVFKTKLLSFNAAVEAERAGEAGRGFSVVAQEVSNLASMSGKSAEEIADIVNQSLLGAREITMSNQQNVEKGYSYVKETADVLNRILRHSEELNSEAEHVDRASQEQLKGVEQINLAIQSIDQAMQKNSAVAEEAAAASEELNHQVDRLNEISHSLQKIVQG